MGIGPSPPPPPRSPPSRVGRDRHDGERPTQQRDLEGNAGAVGELPLRIEEARRPIAREDDAATPRTMLSSRRGTVSREPEARLGLDSEKALLIRALGDIECCDRTGTDALRSRINAHGRVSCVGAPVNEAKREWYLPSPRDHLRRLRPPNSLRRGAGSMGELQRRGRPPCVGALQAPQLEGEGPSRLPSRHHVRTALLWPGSPSRSVPRECAYSLCSARPRLAASSCVLSGGADLGDRLQDEVEVADGGLRASA